MVLDGTQVVERIIAHYGLCYHNKRCLLAVEFCSSTVFTFRLLNKDNFL